MDDEAFENLVSYAASELKRRGTPDAVRADLLARGAGAELADRLLAEAARRNRAAGLRAGLKYLLIGAGCLAAGIAITAGTYEAVRGTGGTYVIAIGLLGFGVGFTAAGLIRLLIAASRGR